MKRKYIKPNILVKHIDHEGLMYVESTSGAVEWTGGAGAKGYNPRFENDQNPSLPHAASVWDD